MNDSLSILFIGVALFWYMPDERTFSDKVIDFLKFLIFTTLIVLRFYIEFYFYLPCYLRFLPLNFPETLGFKGL
jgi:hypothetical protein